MNKKDKTILSSFLIILIILSGGAIYFKTLSSNDNSSSTKVTTVSTESLKLLTPPPNEILEKPVNIFPAAFKVHKVENQHILIDTVNGSPDGLPDKLIIIGESAQYEASYVDVIEEEYEVCGEKESRTLSRFKVPDLEPAQGLIAFTDSGSPITSESFDRSLLIEKKMEPALIEELTSELKNSDSEARAVDIINACSYDVAGDVEEIKCEHASYLRYRGNIVAESSNDYGSPSVKLEMFLVIKGQKFLLIKNRLSGSESGYTLISEDGKNQITVYQGQYPTMC